MWTAFEQAGNVKLGPVLGRTASSAPIFEDEGEKRALLLRMGTGPTAWAYLDTLARAARMSRKALRPKLEALEQEGLVASTSAPAGLRYRLTDEGRRLRAG
jgi:DNA-binding MarR family transcriptional regulator